MGVCAGGADKLPVPRSSRFRREPEDAVCGRNSGPTDSRLAAQDRKVSCGVNQATVARKGGSREGGSQYRLHRASGQVCGRRRQGSRPLWAPFLYLAGPGAAGVKPHGFGPSPRAVLGPEFRFFCLVLGAGAWEQERSEKAGVSESLGQGLPHCPHSLGLPADLEALQ